MTAKSAIKVQVWAQNGQDRINQIEISHHLHRLQRSHPSKVESTNENSLTPPTAKKYHQ